MAAARLGLGGDRFGVPLPEVIAGLLMIGGGVGRGRLRVAARPGRRRPHRAAADARLRSAAARGGRRQPRVGHRDEQRLGGGLPPAPRGEPAARDDPRAVHRVGALAGGLVAFLVAEQILAALFAGAARLRRRLDAPSRASRRPRRSPRADRRRHAIAVRREPDARATSSGCPGPGYRVRNIPLGVGRQRRGGRHVGAARGRRRHRQGPGDAPRHGRAAPGRDGDEQPDDRRHRVGERDRSTCSAAGSTRSSPARPRSACSSARRSARGSPIGSTCACCGCCSSSSSSTRRSR